LTKRGAATKWTGAVEIETRVRSPLPVVRTGVEAIASSSDAEPVQDIRDLLDRFVDHNRKNPNQKLTPLQKRMQSGGW
jgi:hypothetical protein